METRKTIKESRIKLAALLFILLFINSGVIAKNISGYWSGPMEMSGKTIDISIDLISENHTFSSYDLMLLEQPISKLTFKNGIINFSVILDVEILFNGKLSDQQITGSAIINGGPPNMNIVFSLERQAKKPIDPYSIDSLIIKSHGAQLSAEIYKPNTQCLHPAIVLIHGSTSNLRSNYIYDADYFAKLGFEVLLFDKRGCGKSTGDYSSSNYDDLIADVISCLEIMYKRESVDKNKIVLWGISQGAMLLPKIASKTDIPKFLIAKSPEVMSVTEAAAFSDSLRILRFGYSVMNAHVASESHRTVKRMISEGNTHTEVESYINQNALQYPFMNQTGLYGNIEISEDEFNGFYWQGKTENFIPYWEKINIPTLVLFGGRDSYVNALRNDSILQNFNNKFITTKLFTNANHNLKKSFNPSIDQEFDWPRLIEGYTDSIENWIEINNLNN